ncbi:MAG TPA: diguanylate cyclase, partial [Thermosynechococcaceae cyanobacterium]
PLSDRLMAQLLRKLQTYQPLAIGLDIYRDLPVEPGHEELLAAYRSLPQLVGIEQIRDKASPGVPPAPALSPRQVGFNNLVFDVDNKVRRSLLYWTVDGKDHRSFALSLALPYLQARGITPQPAQNDPHSLQLGQAVFRRLAANDGAYTQIDAGGYQFLANLRGSANHFRRVSVTDLLEGRVPSEQLRDRIVLIGSTAVSLKDFFFTSYSGGLATAASGPQPMAGVELQAHLISQILSAAMNGRSLLQVWNEPLEWAWILLWAWVGARVSWKLRSPLRASLALLLASSILAGVCYGAFLAGWWLPLIPPALAMGLSTIGIMAHIAHLQDELKRSKEFLNKIINTIPDPIFVKDQFHHWVVLNQAYCRFLGYSPEELLQKSDCDVFPSHEVEVFHQQDQRVFEESRELEHEEEFTNRAGKTYQIATKRSLHKDAAGNLFLVGVIRDITERKLMEEELKRTAAELVRSNVELQLSADRLNHLANHDTLTGLPNRKLFQERLAQAIEWASENSQQVGLLFMDLDGFKQINDSLGHNVGDLLLKAVGRRLTGCLRGSDTVSRLGGDEFTVILPGIPTVQDAARVADKILATLAHPFELQDQTIAVTLSIGVSLYPQDANTAEDLIKAADTAMYRAKELGKNRHQFASDQLASDQVSSENWARN